MDSLTSKSDRAAELPRRRNTNPVKRALAPVWNKYRTGVGEVGSGGGSAVEELFAVKTEGVMGNETKVKAVEQVDAIFVTLCPESESDRHYILIDQHRFGEDGEIVIVTAAHARALATVLMEVADEWEKK